MSRILIFNSYKSFRLEDVLPAKISRYLFYPRQDMPPLRRYSDSSTFSAACQMEYLKNLSIVTFHEIFNCLILRYPVKNKYELKRKVTIGVVKGLKGSNHTLKSNREDDKELSHN